MAERFNLTAQLQLQAPTNTAQVVGQIKKQLRGATVDVKIKANPREVAAINKQLQNVNKSADSSAKSVGVLNQNLASAARRFSAITVATGSFLALARAVKNSVKEAIAFERELIKISQVTGKSTRQLTGLTDEVTRLSRTLGASSGELLSVARTLAQAGFSAEKTKQALEVLAQTTLAATFSSIQDSTEAAIAVLRQFSRESKAAGGDIKFLESTMSAINSVSKSFAVEAGDLTTVIRRVGGVFSSAGGSVNELIALFTSVRATTRESAETIATGLRTIFTRIQRTDTVDQLKTLGIQLRDSQGQFVGAYEAVKRLSAGLSALDPRDFRFSDIVEELGGFRQVGKVIPLIQQFAVAQNALNVAQGASGSVAKDARIAQQGLGVQISKVREDFEALIRQFADSSTFRSVANGALEIARAMIKVASALEDVLPLITTFASLKLGQALAPGLGAFIGGAFGGRRKNQGGRIHAFARGGFVPGTGNRDTVPAMLQPGEFVIKKSSVNKLGVGTLAAMNENRFATGGGSLRVAKTGKISQKDINVATSTQLKQGLSDPQVAESSKAKIRKEMIRREGDKNRTATLKSGIVGGLFLQKGAGGTKGFNKQVPPAKSDALPGALKGVKSLQGQIYTGMLDNVASKEVSGALRPALENAVAAAASRTMSTLEIEPLTIDENRAAKRAVAKVDTKSIEGFIFEAFISAISGAKLSETGATFDFMNPSKAAQQRLSGIFRPDPTNVRLLDAKRTLGSESVQSGKGSIANKVLSAASAKLLSPKDFHIKKASGGGISGSDTVPALLTPGEYVVNKSAAQSIGYASLNKMNQTGVKGFAAGGVVTEGRHAYGNGPPRSLSKIRSLSDLVKPRGGADPARRASEMSLDKIAGAAQQFAFLGGMAASLGSQFTNLNDETQKAISSTAAFTTSILGIGGTLVQMFTSMSTASLASATADTTEAAASNKAALANSTAGSKFGTALGVGALAATAVAGGFHYFEAKARASADNLEKAGKKVLDQIAVGEGSGSKFADLQRQEAEKRAAAGALSSGKLWGGGAALVAGLGAAATSTAAGTFGGSTGGPLGAALGLLAGAVAGVVVGYGAYSVALAAANAEIESQANLLKDSSDALTAITRASYEFDAALKRSAEEVGRTDEERRDIKGTGIDTGLIEMKLASQSAAETLAILATKMEKPVGALSEADFEDAPALAIAFKNALETQSRTNTLAGKVSAEAAKSLAEIGKIEITGDLSFEELMRTSETYRTAVERTTDAVRQQQTAIVDEAKSRKEAADAAVAKARSKSGEGSVEFKLATKEAAQASAELTKAEENAGKAIDEVTNGQKRLTVIAAKLSEANARNAAIMDKMAMAAQRAEQSLNRFVALNMQLDDFERVLGNVTALIDNTQMDLTPQKIVGLQDLSRVGDRDRFERSVQGLSITSNDPVVRKSAAETLKFSDAIAKARSLFAGKTTQDILGGDTGKGADQVSALLQKIGIEAGELGTDLPPKIFEALAKIIGDAGGRIPIEKIVEVLKEQGEKLAEPLKALEDLRRRDVQQYQSYVNTMAKIRDREIQAGIANIDAENRVAEMMATARGQMSQQVMNTKKEERRVKRAQAALTGIQDSTGQQVQAGNVNQLLRVRMAAEKRRLALQDLPEGITETQRKNRIAEQSRLTDVIKRTTEELGRLGDQSDRAAEIMGEIRQEGNKRKIAKDLLQDFVFGGAADRNTLNRGLFGVHAARMTGTVQNQSEEQRKLTLGMLDRLGDIKIGGIEASKLKEGIIFKDAIRMGLDPQIAHAIATATTKEEELINSLDNLGKIIIAATEAQGTRLQPMDPNNMVGGGGVQGFANGGIVRGSGGRDSKLARVSPGEFVVRRQAAQGNYGMLEEFNRDGIPKFQWGGFAGMHRSRMHPSQNWAMWRARVQQQGPNWSRSRMHPSQNWAMWGAMHARNRMARRRRQIENTGGKGLPQAQHAEEWTTWKNRRAKKRWAYRNNPTLWSQMHREDQEAKRKVKERRESNARFTEEQKQENRRQARDRRRLGLKPDGTARGLTSAQKRIDKEKAEGRIRTPVKRGLTREEKLAEEIELGRQKVMADSAARRAAIQKKLGIDPVTGLKKGQEAADVGAVASIKQRSDERKRAHRRLPRHQTGGPIHGRSHAQGGTLAELEDGEFVINKRSAQQIGPANLRKLNQSGLSQFQNGGFQRPRYTNAPGGKRNGVISSGADMAGNGQMGLALDATKVGEVLANFNNTFKQTLQEAINPFTSMSESLKSLNDTFANLTMTHKFQGDLSMAFNITNQEELTTAIAKAITPKVGELIAQKIDANMLDQSQRTG